MDLPAMSMMCAPMVLIPPRRMNPLITPPVHLTAIDQTILYNRLDYLYLFDANDEPANRPVTPPQNRRQYSSGSQPAYNSPPMGRIQLVDQVIPYMDEHQMVEALRDTLEEYHPLAGRLAYDTTARMSLLLTDDGVGWVSSRCTMTLAEVKPFATNSQFGNHSNQASFDHHHLPLLVTSVHHSVVEAAVHRLPLVVVQHTRFACGSVSLGISAYNCVMDSDALFVFVKCWALSCRGLKFSTPSHDREMINSLVASPNVNFVHDEFLIIDKPPPEQKSNKRSYDQTINQSTYTKPVQPSPMGLPVRVMTFRFTHDEIDRMKSICLSASSPSVSSISSPRYSLTHTHSSAQPITPSFTPSPFALPQAMLTNSTAMGRSVTATVASSSNNPQSPAATTDHCFSQPRTSPHHIPITPYHPSYISTFDVLAAHVWQLIIRARLPHLVASLPPPATTASTPSGGITSPNQSPSHSSRFSFTSPPSQSSRPRNLQLSLNHSNNQSINQSNNQSNNQTISNQCYSPTSLHDTPVHCAIAFNGRNKLDPPLPDMFCANVTFFSMIGCPVGVLLTADLRTICRMIRDKMNRMVSEYLRSALTVLAAPLPSNQKLVPSFHGSLATSDVLFTSFLKSPCYSTDFGWGQPNWVGLCGSVRDNFRWQGMVAFFPTVHNTFAIDVTIALKPEEMARFESDPRLHMYKDVLVSSSESHSMTIDTFSPRGIQNHIQTGKLAISVAK